MSRLSPSTVTPDAINCVAVPIDECPQCASRRFKVDLVLDEVVFRCLQCAAGWRVELGFVWGVE